MSDRLRHARWTLAYATLLATPLALLSGCGDSADATVDVILEAEDVITDGLEPGDSTESIRDGWAVRFDNYIAGVGAVDLHLAAEELDVEAPELFAVDLSTVPAQGLNLWSLSGLASGRWDFFYSTTIDDAERHESVDEEDFTSLTDNDWTYLIRGSLQKEDGISCPPAALATPPADAVESGSNAGGDTCYENPVVGFEIGAEAETTYGPCEIDGLPGVAATSGQSTTVSITIHGDHLFFNGFPEGSEGGTIRLAQWLADCDLNLDGMVDNAELQAIKPSDLPEIDERYQLGGSPITPLDSMYTYVQAQLKTQGHYQGEGECPADGAEHDH